MPCATPTVPLPGQSGKLLSVVSIQTTAKKGRKAVLQKTLKTKQEKVQFRQTVVQQRCDPPRFQGQTFLEKLAVSDRVALDYAHRMEELHRFAKAQGYTLKKKNTFDEVCCKFVNNMFELGFDLQDGTKTLAAIIDANPGYGPRHMLPRTRRALHGWSKTEPQKTRPPLPWPLIAAMTLAMLKKGRAHAAAGVLLMFSAYLRPGEMLDLQIGDLVAPMPGKTCFSLHLHPAERREQSKVGLSDESMLLDSQNLQWLGLVLAQLQRSSAYLINLTYQQLSQHWKEALKAVGLEENHAVLYQLRHSGPSHDRFHHLRTALEVKQRGRWASDASVRRYEAHARINQEFHCLPQKTQKLCLQAEKELAMRGPQTFWSKPVTTAPGRKYVLEIFSGCARFSIACADAGFTSFAYDIAYGPSCDLLSTSVLEKLKRASTSHIYIHNYI